MDSARYMLIVIGIVTGCGEETVSQTRDFSTTVSQTRQPGESFDDAEKRFRDGLTTGELDEYLNLHSAKSLAITYTADMAVTATAYGSYEDVETAFELVRDARFLDDPEVDGFKRRSSWMYPDNGCYARADLMMRNAVQAGYGAPSKVFAFGSLAAATNNSAYGAVYWWYHVVPIVKVDEEAYVFDPAVQPARPLSLQEWVASISTNPEEVKLAFCNSFSYGPISRCLTATDGGNERAVEAQAEFLVKERARLEALGRDADAELGTAPPWL